MYILIYAALWNDKGSVVTSKKLSEIYPTSDASLRLIYRTLKNNGLINVERNHDGVFLAKDASEITLFDVYQATEQEGKSIFKSQPEIKTPEENEQSIFTAFRESLMSAEDSFNSALRQVTIADLMEAYRKESAEDGED